MSTDHLDVRADLSEPGDTRPALPEVTVRRNALLALGILVVSLVLGVAYLVRAVGGGGFGAWLLAVLLLALAASQALTAWDARSPLLVADGFGIRLRLGRTWRGLPWSELREVVVEPRTSLFHDGRLLVEPHDPQAALADLDARARRGLRLSSQVYGGPLVVPLGLTTHVGTTTLVEDLVDLADGRARVVELAGSLRGPMVREEHRDTPDGPDGPEGPGSGPGAPVDPSVAHDDEPFDQDAPDPAPGAAPDPGLGDGERAPRDRVTASFGAVRHRLVAATRTGAERRAAVEEEVLEDFEPEVTPLIGPRLRAARERVALSVAEVSARTRIRAHVVEAVEEEDFTPCGGDFYARGHLRTLATVLGLNGEELVADFDAAYAHEPVSASTVLSAGGSGDGDLGARLRDTVRATLAGPRWSVVAAVALCLVLAWSVARFVTAGPDAPQAQGSGEQSAQLASGSQAQTRVVVRTPDRATRVVVRDASGTVVHRARVTPGHPQRAQGRGPLTVSAAEPGQVRVTERDARWERTGAERTVGRADLTVG